MTCSTVLATLSSRAMPRNLQGACKLSSHRFPQLPLQRVCNTVSTVKRPAEAFAPWEKSQVGRRLRAFREAKGWTQTYLATVLGHGVTPQKINNYEAGRDLIPVHIAGRLCGVTGLSFDYIFQGKMGDLPEDVAKKIPAILNDPPPKAAKRA
jgi:DNA-binding XRE family transcriptional regulator